MMAPEDYEALYKHAQQLERELTAHKAALNLCQMALNADIYDTFMELKFEALSEIAKLKLSTSVNHN